MADPRKSVAYDDINAEYTTVKADNSTITYLASATNGSAQVGLAVTFTADDTVALAGDGDGIAGKLIAVSADNFCTVQTGGYVDLPAGTGAGLTNGAKVVGDLLGSAQGYVREVNSAVAAELAVARGMIVNASDTTAVVIRL